MNISDRRLLDHVAGDEELCRRGRSGTRSCRPGTRPFSVGRGRSAQSQLDVTRRRARSTGAIWSVGPVVEELKHLADQQNPCEPIIEKDLFAKEVAVLATVEAFVEIAPGPSKHRVQEAVPASDLPSSDAHNPSGGTPGLTRYDGPSTKRRFKALRNLIPSFRKEGRVMAIKIFSSLRGKGRPHTPEPHCHPTKILYTPTFEGHNQLDHVDDGQSFYSAMTHLSINQTSDPDDLDDKQSFYSAKSRFSVHITSSHPSLPSASSHSLPLSLHTSSRVLEDNQSFHSTRSCPYINLDGRPDATAQDPSPQSTATRSLPPTPSATPIIQAGDIAINSSPLLEALVAIPDDDEPSRSLSFSDSKLPMVQYNAIGVSSDNSQRLAVGSKVAENESQGLPFCNEYTPQLMQKGVAAQQTTIKESLIVASHGELQLRQNQSESIQTTTGRAAVSTIAAQDASALNNPNVAPSGGPTNARQHTRKPQLANMPPFWVGPEELGLTELFYPVVFHQHITYNFGVGDNYFAPIGGSNVGGRAGRNEVRNQHSEAHTKANKATHETSDCHAALRSDHSSLLRPFNYCTYSEPPME